MNIVQVIGTQFFRQSALVQARGRYNLIEQYALRVPISISCLIYLSKSMPVNELRPTVPILDRLRFESSFCKEVELTRVNLVAIRNLVGFINYADQFGAKHLLRIVCRTRVMKHLLSIVSVCNEEQQLLNVIEVRRNRTAFR